MSSLVFDVIVFFLEMPKPFENVIGRCCFTPTVYVDRELTDEVIERDLSEYQKFMCVGP